MQIRSFCLESGRALPHSKTWPYLFPAIDKSQAIFHVRRTCHPEQSEGSRSWSSVPKLRKRVTEKGSFVVYATQDDSARKYASQFTLTPRARIVRCLQRINSSCLRHEKDFVRVGVFYFGARRKPANIDVALIRRVRAGHKSGLIRNRNTVRQIAFGRPRCR